MVRSDLELLRDFAHGGGDGPFDELAARHAEWLFRTARRRLKDDHLADDARQAVLLLLAQKASELVDRNQQAITGWLFHVMNFTCVSLLRTRARQSAREAAANELVTSDQAERPDDGLVQMLEDTISQLPPVEREAIVRRFYQRQEFATIGAMLGMTAEAARKRVTRALAACRTSMIGDGAADAFTGDIFDLPQAPITRRMKQRPDVVRRLAEGAMTMIEQVEAIEFPVMSAEFFVRDVEKNLEFFERLGFRRRFVEPADVTGHVPRASLRGGAARIWLRRSTGDDATRPSPGVTLYFWLDGGEAGLIKHRDAIAAQGVTVNQFYYDVSLQNFTVTTPDGYLVGFFSTRATPEQAPAATG